jgi:hypothetical protein
MLTVVWNPRGLHLIGILAQSSTFNAACYVTEILSPPSKWHYLVPRENRMKTAPDPDYSPDLAPSNFYLFDYVKACLAGLSLESPDEFFEVVQRALEGIKKGRCRWPFSSGWGG